MNNEDYIEHEGRLFQKWGVKNGPPYPLSREDLSSAEAKAVHPGNINDNWSAEDKKKALAADNDGNKSYVSSKGKVVSTNQNGQKKRGMIEQIGYNNKQKKLNATRKANLEKARAAKKANATYDEDKKAAIASGDAKRIAPYLTKMTTQEINDVSSRINQISSIKTKAIGMDNWAKLDKLQKNLNTVANVASAAGNIYNATAKTVNTFGGENWPLWGENSNKDKNAKHSAMKEEAEDYLIMITPIADIKE